MIKLNLTLKIFVVEHTCVRETVHSPYSVTTTNISLWLWKGIQQMKKATTTATNILITVFLP